MRQNDAGARPKLEDEAREPDGVERRPCEEAVARREQGLAHGRLAPTHEALPLGDQEGRP